MECSRGWAWKVLGYVGFESAWVCVGGKGLRMWVWKVLGKFEVVWRGKVYVGWKVEGAWAWKGHGRYVDNG